MMDIEGTYTLQATPEDVWLSLMDSHLIEEAVPGLEHLEQLEEPNFTVAMQVQQAPLSGTYRGRVTVTEQKFPTTYNLSFEGEGQNKVVNGNIILNLEENGDNTIVTYKCVLHISKAGKTLSSTMVKGNIKHLFQQFFAAVADRLRLMNPYVQEEMSQEIVLPPSLPQQTLPPFLPPSPSGQPAFLYALVRFLRLGHGDSEQEAQWVNRLRRVSVVSGLLLLVWVGTRIPRRRRA
ncbi:MAG TPA: SRPBCC domain-containing protein [Ktedonobacteraceae bacterium]|nr:SRPBCC domain-containing protein [Ktedonobacteraceae bacterium]